MNQSRPEYTLDCECAIKKKMGKKIETQILTQNAGCECAMKPKLGKRIWKKHILVKNAGTRFLSKNVSPHEYNFGTSHV